MLCCSCGVLFPGPRGTAQVAGGELDNLTGGCQGLKGLMGVVTGAVKIGLWGAMGGDN